MFEVDTRKDFGVEMTRMGLLAEELKKLRREAGLTQEEVARRLGLARYTYSRYETGKIIPSKEVVERIAEILVPDEVKRTEVLERLFAFRARDIIAREQGEFFETEIPGPGIPGAVRPKLARLLDVVKGDILSAFEDLPTASSRLGLPEEDLRTLVSGSPDNPPPAGLLRRVITALCRTPELGVLPERYERLFREVEPFLPREKTPRTIPESGTEKAPETAERAVFNRQELKRIIEKLERLEDRELERVVKLLDALLDLVE